MIILNTTEIDLKSYGKFLVENVSDSVNEIERHLMKHDITVIVTGVYLKETDAAGLARRVKAIKKTRFPGEKIILVVDNIYNHGTALYLTNSGVDYYFAGEKEKIKGKIIEYVETLEAETHKILYPVGNVNGSSNIIKKLLSESGISEGQKGYEYFESAVQLIISNMPKDGKIWKQIIPVMEENFDTTGKNIMRSVGYSLKIAYEMRKHTAKTGSIILEFGCKPKPVEFIKKVAEAVKNQL